MAALRLVIVAAGVAALWLGTWVGVASIAGTALDRTLIVGGVLVALLWMLRPGRRRLPQQLVRDRVTVTPSRVALGEILDPGALICSDDPGPGGPAAS